VRERFNFFALENTLRVEATKTSKKIFRAESRKGLKDKYILQIIEDIKKELV